MSTPFDIWGAVDLGLTWPTGPLTYILLLIMIGVTAGLFLRLRGFEALRTMSRPEWFIFAGLCATSFLLAQLLPIQVPWANPILRAHPATSDVLLLAALPYLFAAAALNTPAAMLVGLLGGLGRALGQTGEPTDIFAAALVAGLAGWLLQQNYSGRLFRNLRRPVIAGPLTRAFLAPVITLQTIAAIAPKASLWGAVDLGLFLGAYAAVLLVVEGLVGGLLATLLLWILPQYRPERGLVPSPYRRSLQRQLNAAFLSFAAVIVLFSAIGTFIFVERATARALTEQMALNANTVAMQLGTFQNTLAASLERSAADPQLTSSNVQARVAALGRLQRATPQFSRMWIVDGARSLSGVANEAPTTDEQAIAAAALAAGDPRIGITQAGSDRAVSIAVPWIGEQGRPVVLLGRVAPAALEAVLGRSFSAGGGFIVDEQSRVVLASGDVPVQTTWSPPSAEQATRLLPTASGLAIYEVLGVDGARRLEYFTLAPESGWRVVAVVPRSQILRQTLNVAGPLALLLVGISILFFGYVAGLGRSITRPIAEMGQASRAIAGGGGLERPVRSHREDEIGQLTLAFSQMQRALRQRLDELSLLLSISNDVASTVNLGEGMTAVLQGILRGTGAAGARAVIRNPNGPAPLIFAEGPAAESMAVLDRTVVRRMRTVDELALAAPAEVLAELEVSAPVAALFSVPLKLAGEYQGALYLGYRQSHYFDSDERNLLRTIAGQASVLVQNAYLFAAAEGGRRRLAAILASTTNAVIVTDQTDRVLLLNPAMERALGLRAAEASGRLVADALAGNSAGQELARQLTSVGSGPASGGKLELETGGRDFLASVSIVQNSEGQAIGRVAVLQDVTELKEVDRLKTEFVDGISHDLRSPLTYMRTYAGMLPVPDDPELEREYIAKIATGIERMSRLVNDLLDMTRIRAGIDLHYDRVQVDELLREIAQEYASPALMQGTPLQVETARDLAPVKADPTLLRRAITNLLTNALNYSARGGTVVLSAEQTAEEIIISVTDNGPGIAPEDLPNLFQKFYRGRQASSDQAPGSGLGLAIVRSIADLHNGRVWCVSTPGKGSTFSLALNAFKEREDAGP